MRWKLNIARDPEKTVDEAAKELRIDQIVQTILKARKSIVAATAIVMVLTSVYVFLQPDRFTSRSSILPSGPPGRTATLNLLTGLSTSLAGENSSVLFPIILRSNTVCDSVLSRSYPIKSKGATKLITLAEYFGTDNPERLRQKLASLTRIDSDPETELIEIEVETTIPSLSQGIVRQYLEQLDHYNIDGRQSEAKRRAGYLQRELVKNKLELAAAEDALEQFQAVNRNWRTGSDPQLQRQLQDLKRRTEVKSEVYAYLSQEFETARLEIQKDLPIVRVLDGPSLPILKSGPRRILSVLMAGLATLLGMISLVTVKRSYALKQSNLAVARASESHQKKNVSPPAMAVDRNLQLKIE